MFSYKIEANENNQWTEVHGWVRPFTDGQTLDDSLDSGKINLSFVTRSKPYAPFTRIRISVYEGENTSGTPVDVLQYVVDTDDVQCRRLAPSTKKLYDHSIALVELTKLLERDVCDTMTVTNYLGHDFLTYRLDAQPIWGDNAQTYFQAQQVYKNPAIKGDLYTVYSPYDMFKGGLAGYDDGTGHNGVNKVGCKVTAPNGEVIYNVTSEKGSWEAGETQTFILNQTGTYSIYYELDAGNNVLVIQGSVEYLISVMASGSISNSTPWTITDVVNRLLTAGVTRRIGLDAQRYVFDSQQATKYANVLAPEFAFTRGTLFEALLTVGGYIHAIPRLVDENRSDGALTVKFDLLGQDDVYSGTLPLPLYERSSWSGNEYCGALDSTVDNLLNTTDRTQGAVTEPSANTFRAVNTTDGGFRISANDGLVILTDKPIYQVTKLEFYLALGTDPSESGYRRESIDITPYVYESAEYQTLSGYTGQAYPYSKGWALEYTQGQKNIRGLDFVLNAPQGGDTFDKQYAIVNILASATGLNASTFTNYTGLQFRVTYIPYVTSRIVQRKPYLTHPIDNVLLYNQGGNSVENEYYGERLKGTITRIGNITSRKTYIFTSYANIPKAGQKIGNRYVALVDREFDKMRIKATVTTVANFNKLAEYLGLNSNYRLYDVSEKQAFDRAVNYGESCVISETLINNTARTALITNDGINAIQKEFNATYPGTYEKVTAMRMIAKGGRVIGEGAEISPAVGMAAGSFASGNSLVFFVNMLDNYGAGYQSNMVTASIRAQRLMPYSDALGNISTVDVDFVNELVQTDSSPAPQSAFDYPAYDAGGEVGTIYFSTRAINEYDTGGALGVSKDSREALSIVIQQHFQSDNQNIVIGKALTKYCPLVSTLSDEDRGKLYFLNRQLNPLEAVIDLTGLTTSAGSYTTSDEDDSGTDITIDRAFRLVLPANDSGQTAKAWAIINPSTGELYLGRNYPDGLANKATPDSLYFNFLNNTELKQYMIDQNTLGMAE